MKTPKFKITAAAPLHRAASGGMMGWGLLRAVAHTKIANPIGRENHGCLGRESKTRLATFGASAPSRTRDFARDGNAFKSY